MLFRSAEELGRWARLAAVQWRIWRFCARRLAENNVSAMSAALSFRTMFAMVPAMVLVVLILKAVGVLEDGKQSLRQFLEASGFSQITVAHGEGSGDGASSAVGVGAAEGDGPQIADPGGMAARTVNIAEEIERIVDGVERKLTFRRIGPVGVLLLIWTALSLLTTMENSLNRVFGATSARSLGRRLLLYWSVLTLEIGRASCRERV